jgi:hypothetical protein
MSNHAAAIVSIATVLSCGSASAGCDALEGAPLARMHNKTLSFDRGPKSVTLEADGCPLLIPETVEATINGHQMAVDPGRHGTGINDGPCYPPQFGLPAADDFELGATATIVISDSSQTLRVVIVGLPAHLPTLETPTAQPRELHQGGSIKITFSPVEEAPEEATAGFSAIAGPNGCGAQDGVATLDVDAVTIQPPASPCFGNRWLLVDLEYPAASSVQTCENASCDYAPWRPFVFDYYPVTVLP